MRRGGRVFLLLGVVIAAAAAVLLLMVMGGGTSGGAQPVEVAPPTATPELQIQVVAARAQIRNESLVTDLNTFLTTTEIPESRYNQDPGSYFTSFSELANKVATRDIDIGEILRADMFIDSGLALKIPTPESPNDIPVKALSIEVDNLTGVGDQVREGDFVDLVMTFQIERVILRPTIAPDPTTGLPTVTIVEVPTIFRTTKTLVQNVKVLGVLRPAPPEVAADGATPTPAAGAPPPPAGATPPTGRQSGSGFITTGTWTLLIAVNDQQAEIVNFTRAQEPETPITLVLRGRGDTVVEETSGVTLELLVSQFGLPLPEPIPLAPVPVEQLTPGPTRTPTPFRP
ncbi:MAG TPA: RcpC/CpaB family pilus assembly protein [Roseiflexaceae bacterium]|nr:RcpC/CpaB family pilus assembly protein [Roseiflexaceae bacterium]HMP39349.1 RcpC/CpaB family pilus assembly protein [Roseiflexaceae bacterium]